MPKRGAPGGRRLAAAGMGLLALAVSSACQTDGDGPRPPGPARPSSAVRTLAPLPPPPEQPPTGRVRAELRQSSRDAALGRVQVWIDNDTARTLRPTGLRVDAPGLPRPIDGERLRSIPSQSERGYPLPLPARPECGPNRATGPATVRLWQRGRTRVLRAADPADVVPRFVASRCLELALARRVRLSWADRVPVDGAGPGSTARLVLLARPTGRPGPPVRLLRVSGTPLLTPVDGPAWRPRVALTGPTAVRRLELRVRPARCDGHAFGESGGATAFRLRLRIGGRPGGSPGAGPGGRPGGGYGDVLLRMTPTGARSMIGFARESCGL